LSPLPWSDRRYCARATAEKLDVYEYGVYASSPRVAVGHSEQGMVRYQANRIDLVEATRTIVAQIGGQFASATD